MRPLRAILVAFTLISLAFPAVLSAQERTPWYVESLAPPDAGGYAEYSFSTGMWTASNDVVVTYGGIVLNANFVTVNTQTGDASADGRVRIQEGEQIWAGEHVLYNFYTKTIQSGQFRTGLAPMFAEGTGLAADVSNHLYTATDTLITSEDVANPLIRVRAKRIKLIPGKKIEAHDAVLYVGSIPVFYFPFYSRNLTEHAPHFYLLPGYRTSFGPFLLTTYTFWLSDEVDGAVHLDYRDKRGPGVGPDFNYHLGQWGHGTFKYYYTHDRDSSQDQLGVPIPENRQRLYLSYDANPATNLYVKALARYESDLAVVRDFFEGEYRRDPQPDSFVEANKFWQNFSVDAYVQPRLNTFLQNVERLPDIRLTGFRQQVGATPVYYESESSAGYYKQVFAENA